MSERGGHAGCCGCCGRLVAVPSPPVVVRTVEDVNAWLDAVCDCPRVVVAASDTSGCGDDVVAVRRVTLDICDMCLSGAGGVCHVPGCALIRKSAPDIALDPSCYDVAIDAEPKPKRTLADVVEDPPSGWKHRPGDDGIVWVWIRPGDTGFVSATIELNEDLDLCYPPRIAAYTLRDEAAAHRAIAELLDMIAEVSDDRPYF